MLNIDKEIFNIINFIKQYVYEDEIVVIPVSGGIDSDVTARLCYKALGENRIKLFIAKERGMEERFLKNARNLAKDLHTKLVEISLNDKSLELLQILENGDTSNIFHANSILEIGKASCSLRSAIISCYQDKGYIIAGCTNRTEYELGFFVTFGDNLANFKPIEHLYKNEVIKMAKVLGTRNAVMEQAPSAGFWKNQKDLEDISYWIVNRGPILKSRTFTDKEIEKAETIEKMLTWNKLDTCLQMIREERKFEEISKITKIPVDIIIDMKEVIRKAKKYKSREILKSLR